MKLTSPSIHVSHLCQLKNKKTVVKPVKSMLAAVFCFVTICAIVLYFLRYGKFISFICLMMLRIVDFLMNS